MTAKTKTVKNGMMLWTDAYLADTGHLTTLEHGAYLLILMAMWRSPDGKLRNDKKILCRCSKLTMANWRHVEKTIMPLLLIDGEFVTQKRLMIERQTAIMKTIQKRVASNRRWHPKSLENNNTTDANASSPHMQNGLFADAPNPNPNPASKKERKKDIGPRARALGKHRLPDDWTPGDDGFKYASEHGFGKQRADQMFEAFRTHHIGHGTKWEKWNLAWQQWVRNEVAWSRNRGGQKSGSRSFVDIARGG